MEEEIFIYDLVTIGSIDPVNDWMVIEDTSTGETKKVAPASLPISTATQSALDGKVDENSAITGATKPKITYDSKGLVTGGEELNATDIPTGINALKVGDANVSNTEFGYLDGVTSSIQTQLNSKQAELSTNTNPVGLNGQELLNFVPDTATLNANTTLNSGNAATYNSLVVYLDGALTITLDASLPNGFNITFIQDSAHTSTFAGAGGLLIKNRQDHTKNNGRYSGVSIVKKSSTIAILVGDTSL